MLKMMPAESRERPHRWFILFAGIAGGLAIAVGLAVLTGWSVDIPLLTRGAEGMIPMNPLTAVGFIFSGSSLVMQFRPGVSQTGCRRAARVLAFLTGVIGLSVICGVVLGWDFHPDQILFASKLRGDDGWLSRMAMLTASCFVFLGLGLGGLEWTARRGIRLAEIVAMVIGIISMAVLVGYFYRVSWLYGIGARWPMAVHTAATFQVLALGLAFARPGEGLMGIVTGEGPGGLLARRMVPLMVLVIFLLGNLSIMGIRRGIQTAELGIALHTVVTMAISGILILWCARSVHHSEANRIRVENDREKFFTLSLDMLVIAGTDGYFKRVNPSICRILGYSEEEILARPFLDLVHPDDVPATLGEIKKLEAGQPTVHFENRYRCGDGTWKWLVWNTQPSEDNLLYAVARDVTAQKKSEEDARQTHLELLHQTARLKGVNQELESFSYSVSHDLRAPLRGIAGFALALEEQTEGRLDEISQGYLQRVRKAADRMAELIDDLLKLSRLTRAEMRLEMVDLSEIARSVIDELRHAEPGRTVETVIEPDIRVFGDSALLRVLLNNLIGNAWKFTGRNPAAKIEMGSFPGEGGGIVTFVRDNGVGFDPRYAHKLFGAFQRLHSQAEFPGTGIGLATVQRIILRHGGEVIAEGGINHGATFKFMLAGHPTDEKQDHHAGRG